MSRLYDDGGSFTYDAANGALVSVKFGEKSGGAEFDGKPGNTNFIAENTPAVGESYIAYDFAAVAAKVAAAGVAGNAAYNENLDEAVEMFVARADNTMIGNMRDCGECHVGGGGMEYFPRNEGWDGTAAGGRVPYRGTAQVEAEYTSFNYFIDVFDEDGDNDKNEPLFNDFAKTGVIEMDCLMCHMKGYSLEDSKEAKRAGRFDASRAAGAGFGTVDATKGYTAGVMDAGYGTHVVYDTDVVTLDGANYVVNLNGKIESVPPAENCASCHQGKYQVDWKKRGEMSPATDVHAALGCMGCHERNMDPTTAMTADGILEGGAAATAASVGTSLNIRDGKLGHDPAKGNAGQWDSLNNKNDNVNFKTCNACHSGTGLGDRGKSYGAPNPAGAHAAAGVSAMIVQDGRTGVANKSHLDVISCEACHIRKSSEVPHSLDGGVTTETYASGGCFVDGSGPDHEGRLATHDTKFVSRPMYTEAGGSNFGYTWDLNKKIHPGNYLTSLFWRDKNDVDYDVNVDGRPHGMDAVLPTHILKNAIDNAADPAHPAAYALLADGVSTDAEVGAHITKLKTTLNAMTGITGKTQKLKLSWVTVPFTMSHQIEPAADAFGAGGCTDCHGSDQFYKGTIDMNGYAKLGFIGSTQTAPMTKVQGGGEKTFGHPNMKDKFQFISIPLMNNNGTDVTNGAGSVPAGATNTIRNSDRSEGLYEATFRTRDGAFKDTISSSAPIVMDSSANKATTWKGWLLKLEVCDTAADATCATFANRSMMFGPSGDSGYFAHADADPTVAEMLLNMPANFKNGTFGFTVAPTLIGGVTETGGITITTDATHKIRVNPKSNYADFQLTGDVLKAAPIIPTCKGVDADDSISGRTEMVAYLDALGVVQPSGLTRGEECFGIGVAPTVDPVLSGVGVVTGVTQSDGVSTYTTVTANVAVTVGVTPTNGFTYFSYYQDIADASDTGVTVTGGAITFPAAGTYRVVTSATNVEGKITNTVQYVKVAAALTGDFAAPTFGTDLNGDITVELNLDSSPGTYTSALVNWADGTAQNYYAGSGTALTNVYPIAMSGQTVRVNVAFYNGTDVVAAWAQDILLP